ncbi:MAG: HD-GYP domain-containing protein [Candidatus Omnitrophica bacterium CG02_land_8_20_14_3_00__42_8]|nr:MAG: HD-GYP domain-containing protein [Candidatus Omnitrophica bacterium CG02_land_8_20_14_3_00__42_8]
MRQTSIDNITKEMKLGKDIYSAEGIVLLARGQELKAKYVERLRNLGIYLVYIEDKRVADVEVKDLISEQTRREATKIIKDTMLSLKKKRAIIEVRGIKETVNEMVDEIIANRHLLINLLDMRSYDDYLYNHSVGVCILSLTIGIAYKYDELRLRDLGVGALLHDVGKTKISSEILNKPGKLTAEEFEEIKKHSRWGFDMLRGEKELSLLSSHIAYQHHERCDGRGYPRGLSEEETLQFARIVSVADVYDALTADRIYRKRFLPHEARKIIESNLETQFSLQIVKIFFENVALYPVGTMVKLSTGERGVVMKTERGFASQPQVRVLYNEKGEELERYRERNLREEPTISITKVVE